MMGFEQNNNRGGPFNKRSSIGKTRIWGPRMMMTSEKEKETWSLSYGRLQEKKKMWPKRGSVVPRGALLISQERVPLLLRLLQGLFVFSGGMMRLSGVRMKGTLLERRRVVCIALVR